jgi:DNA transformation protein and related proteins
MPVSEEYLNYVSDQLSKVGEIETKRMFGGVGFFKDGHMFGKIGDDTFRLKVDSSNQQQYEERGMKPFYSESKKKGMPYWEVPQEILEDRDKLAEWALQSLSIAKSSK